MTSMAFNPELEGQRCLRSDSLLVDGEAGDGAVGTACGRSQDFPLKRKNMTHAELGVQMCQRGEQLEPWGSCRDLSRSGDRRRFSGKPCNVCVDCERICCCCVFQE